MTHKHGWSYPPPRTKPELIRHLEQSHPDRVKVAIESHRWTRVALEELHRTIHVGEYA